MSLMMMRTTTWEMDLFKARLAIAQRRLKAKEYKSAETQFRALFGRHGYDPDVPSSRCY